MLKNIFFTKSVKCDISKFSEFHQDYESSGLILFSESWIFANFVTKQPAVISTTSCYLQHSVQHQRVGSKSTEWYIYLLCFVRWLHKHIFGQERLMQLRRRRPQWRQRNATAPALIWRLIKKDDGKNIHNDFAKNAEKKEEEVIKTLSPKNADS